MSWQVDSHAISPGIVLHRLKCNEEDLSFRDVAGLWIEDVGFVDFYTEVLRRSPCPAYFWEVKPVTRAAQSDAFEFALIESAYLAQIPADPAAFSGHLTGDREVMSFPNLGGDAQLVAPAEISARANYGHLAAFVRHAPAAQVRLFWRVVGEEYHKVIDTNPCWLSTAGPVLSQNRVYR